MSDISEYLETLEPFYGQRERDRLKRVARRIKWLESRVSVYVGKDDSFDKAELSALTWVIEELAKAKTDTGKEKL